MKSACILTEHNAQIRQHLIQLHKAEQYPADHHHKHGIEPAKHFRCNSAPDFLLSVINQKTFQQHKKAMP